MVSIQEHGLSNPDSCLDPSDSLCCIHGTLNSQSFSLHPDIPMGNSESNVWSNTAAAMD